MRFCLFFASAAPVTVVGGAGCLDGCGEADSEREGEEGDSAIGDGEAQRTGRLLSTLLLPLSLPLSALLVACESSPVRAIPTSMLLYGLLDLLALDEVARATALRFLDMPMRFIMSFSMAGMRIERFLWSFLLAVVLCVERRRAAEVSRVTCGTHRQG